MAGRATAIVMVAALLSSCTERDPAPQPSPTAFALPAQAAARDRLCLGAATELVDTTPAAEKPAAHWEASLAESQLAALIVTRDNPATNVLVVDQDNGRVSSLAGEARQARKAMQPQPDWAMVRQACAAAFPPTAPGRPIDFPRDPGEAAIRCATLAAWTRGFADGSADREAFIARNDRLRERLRPLVQPRGDGLSLAQLGDAMRDAFYDALRLGRPAGVLDACEKRFPPAEDTMTPTDDIAAANAVDADDQMTPLNPDDDTASNAAQ